MLKDIIQIRRKILCIEDSKSARKVMEIFFKDYGYDYLIAKDGYEGMELFEKESPSLVLCDLKMPGKSGLVVLSEVKKINQDIPFIMISGVGNMEQVINALRLGAYDFITKPVDFDELKHTLERSLERYRLLSENKIYREKLEELVEHRTIKLKEEVRERKEAEDKLFYRAYHDELTNLPNRALLLDRLAQVIAKVKRNNNDHQYAVLYLDLDKFKLINDSLGHMIGDKLLIEVSQRLKTCVRETDTISRFGGDEFAILLEDVQCSDKVIEVVNRIKKLISEPFNIDKNEIHITTSVGVVLSPKDYDDPELILRDADIAMYKSKNQGRNQFKIFKLSMRNAVIKLLETEGKLRQAIDNNEFIFHYQPIINLSDYSIYGFEALIRWNHPIENIIYPNEFIDIAESTGLIIPIGTQMIDFICKQVAMWQKKYNQKYIFAINISAKQFLSDDLIDIIQKSIMASGVNANTLEFELTETIVMENAEIGVDMLTRLKSLGVRISIDDFGTGYSSLSYLHTFPIDTLKIDQSFISKMNGNEHTEIVKSIIQLAHSLNLDVVAEGVEMPKQVNILKSLNCEKCQGYLFFKPLTIEETEEKIKNGFTFKKKPY